MKILAALHHAYAIMRAGGRVSLDFAHGEVTVHIGWHGNHVHHGRVFPDGKADVDGTFESAAETILALPIEAHPWPTEEEEAEMEVNRKVPRPTVEIPADVFEEEAEVVDKTMRMEAMVKDSTFLKRFMEHQAGRDREQEYRDYVANTAVRLKNAADKTVREWSLADLPTFPREIPYALEWGGRYYRINAIVPRGIIPGATHTFKNEIIGLEITAEDPLRDYEREQGPYKLPEEMS